MGFAPERLMHVIHRNMESYACPFAVPPIVWICNVNFTHRSIIMLAQLVTYPVGTDIYTAAALPCINGWRGLTEFTNNEGSRKVVFVEKLLDVCNVPWSKQTWVRWRRPTRRPPRSVMCADVCCELDIMRPRRVTLTSLSDV